MTEAELFRREGKEFRSVRLSVDTDGAVHLDAQDMGSFVQKIWGDGDYEYGIRICGALTRCLKSNLMRLPTRQSNPFYLRYSPARHSRRLSLLSSHRVRTRMPPDYTTVRELLCPTTR